MKVILKACTKGYASVSMSLSIDWDTKSIWVCVKKGYVLGGCASELFPASDFYRAIERFNEWAAELELTEEDEVTYNG